MKNPDLFPAAIKLALDGFTPAQGLVDFLQKKLLKYHFVVCPGWIL